jgi:hypothetical protein
MGVSMEHASSVPLLLNPSSGVISPQFHVVFDDWFATTGVTDDEFPDFNSETWQKMFGDSRYQYMHADEEDEREDVEENTPEGVMMDVMERQSRVESAMDREVPPTPLPVADPPTTTPPENTSLTPMRTSLSPSRFISPVSSPLGSYSNQEDENNDGPVQLSESPVPKQSEQREHPSENVPFSTTKSQDEVKSMSPMKDDAC